MEGVGLIEFGGTQGVADASIAPWHRPPHDEHLCVGGSSGGTSLIEAAEPSLSGDRLARSGRVIELPTGLSVKEMERSEEQYP